MNEKIINLQSMLEKNNRLDATIRGQFEESASEINIFHHQLSNIAHFRQLAICDDRDAAIDDDDPQLLEPGRVRIMNSLLCG